MEKLIFILPLLFFGCGDIPDKRNIEPPDTNNYSKDYEEEYEEETQSSKENNQYVIVLPESPPNIIVPESNKIDSEDIDNVNENQNENINDTNTYTDVTTNTNTNLNENININNDKEDSSEFPKTSIPQMPIIAF